jgi:hypothetical protein
MIRLVLPRRLPSNRLLRRYCLADREVLVTLAPEASRPRAVDDLCDRFSLIPHDLQMAGVYKRTNLGRLIGTERMLPRYVTPEPAMDVVFLDVGASDGVTTVETLRALRLAFGNHVIAYAADLSFWLLRYRRGPVVEYRAVDAEPIMVRVGPFGVRLSRRRHALAQQKGDFWGRLYFAVRATAPQDAARRPDLAGQPSGPQRARPVHPRNRLPPPRRAAGGADLGDPGQQSPQLKLLQTSTDRRGDRPFSRLFANRRLPRRSLNGDGVAGEARTDRSGSEGRTGFVGSTISAAARKSRASSMRGSPAKPLKYGRHWLDPIDEVRQGPRHANWARSLTQLADLWCHLCLRLEGSL